MALLNHSWQRAGPSWSSNYLYDSPRTLLQSHVVHNMGACCGLSRKPNVPLENRPSLVPYMPCVYHPSSYLYVVLHLIPPPVLHTYSSSLTPLTYSSSLQQRFGPTLHCLWCTCPSYLRRQQVIGYLFSCLFFFSQSHFDTHAQNQTLQIRLRRKSVQSSVLELFVPSFIFCLQRKIDGRRDEQSAE